MSIRNVHYSTVEIYAFAWENGSVYSKTVKGERIFEKEIALRASVMFIFFVSVRF